MGFTDNSGTLLVTCPDRIAPTLREEIEGMGYVVADAFATGVVLTGTVRDAMRLNLWCRTGYRVLSLLDEVWVHNPDGLYSFARTIEWERWIPSTGMITVHGVARHHTVRDTRFPMLRVKDAIVDRLRERNGSRPDASPDHSGASVYLRWDDDDRCSLWIDTTGVPLTRRGYRHNPWRAPMHEALAAAIVRLTGWDPATPFVNPMCGSGTLAVEAALAGANIPPGIFRNHFSFMGLVGYEQDVWQEMREAAEGERRMEGVGPIIASDNDPGAISAARENARSAGVESLIRFETCDVAETTVPEEPGVIIVNPGYGARMGEEEELAPLYKRIGDMFKTRCQGYSAFVFTGSRLLAGSVGLRASARIPLYNSTIDTRLLRYQMYVGSRRQPGGVESHE